MAETFTSDSLDALVVTVTYPVLGETGLTVQQGPSNPILYCPIHQDAGCRVTYFSREKKVALECQVCHDLLCWIAIASG